MESYLQKLAAVSSIQHEIITHLPQLKAILGHKSCAVSNLFSSLDFQFHFIRYNSRLLQQGFLSLKSHGQWRINNSQQK